MCVGHVMYRLSRKEGAILPVYSRSNNSTKSSYKMLIKRAEGGPGAMFFFSFFSICMYMEHAGILQQMIF